MRPSNKAIVVIATFAALACDAKKQPSTAEKTKPDSAAAEHKPPRHRRVIRALDANGDGQISADEIRNAPTVLKTFDRNKDGRQITQLKQPIDIVFIDADKEGYIDYLKKLLPLVRPGGLILAHNAAMGMSGVDKYFKTVAAHPGLETILLNMHAAGMGVTLKKR